MEAAVLAIDIGTSKLKAALCTATGRPAGRSVVALPSRPRGEGLHEVDPEDWIRAVGEAVAAPGMAGRKVSVEAVVVSGHGPTLTGVGSEGRPVMPALSWLDRRAGAEAAELQAVWHPGVAASHFLPKVLWLQRHDPETYDRVRWFLGCPEYLSFVLTGNARTVLPAAGFEPYYWTPEILAATGTDRGRLPGFIAPGECMGTVRPEAGERLGIPAGVPVIAGGPDFAMSLVGTATIEEGLVCDRAGTSEGVNLCSRRPVRDPALLCFPHVVPGHYNVSVLLGGTGLAVQWLRELYLGPAGETAAADSVESAAESGAASGVRPEAWDVFEGIESVPPGSRGLVFLPQLSGARKRGAFVGLSSTHSRLDLARAVAESLGFALRQVLDSCRRCGLGVRQIRMSGGQARSPALLQVKADIGGVPVAAPRVVDAELVGGAAYGFVGLGVYGDIVEASRAMVEIERVWEPRPGAARAYEAPAEAWERASHLLGETLGAEPPPDPAV